MDSLTTLGYDALDRGVIPDLLVRRAIRYLCNQRLREIAQNSIETAVQHKWEYIEALKQNQVAIEQDKANEQHYEVSFPRVACRSVPSTNDRTTRTASSPLCSTDLSTQVSTEFIQSCLGPNLKYSCCLYPTGKETLAQAEELMLESYCTKARLEDGMDILDLGCGWGSLTLFLAKVRDGLPVQDDTSRQADTLLSPRLCHIPGSM